jgi:hypothetical protein
VASESLKEFLVSLGFKIDEPGLAKFETALGRATARAVNLGSAVAATATAVGIAVAKVAEHFEDLYWAAQRTDNTVAGMQATQAGLRQVGISADQSRGAIEAFTRALNLQPGLKGLLAQWGIGVEGREKVDVMLDVVERLQKMGRPGSVGFAVAQQFANMFGVPYEIMVKTADDIKKAREEAEAFKKVQKDMGFDAGAAAAKFTEFNLALAKMWGHLSVLGDAIMTSFVGPAEAAVKVIDELVLAFGRLNKDTGGAAGVGAAGVGFLAAGGLGAWVLKRILGMIGSMLGVGGAPAATAAATAGTGTAAATATTAAEVAAGTTFGLISRFLLGPLGAFLGMTTETGGEEPGWREGPRGREFDPGAPRPQGRRDAPTTFGTEPPASSRDRPRVTSPLPFDKRNFWTDDEAERARLYEPRTPLAPAPGDGKPRSVTVNNNATVTIHGADDPKRTGAEVEGALGRTFGDMVRNSGDVLR